MAAAAVIEAEKFNSTNALMLVHSHLHSLLSQHLFAGLAILGEVRCES